MRTRPSHQKAWKSTEMEFVKNNYHHMTIKTMAKYLCRSYCSTRGMISRLMITKHELKKAINENLN